MAQYKEKEASPLITENAKIRAINVFVNGYEIRSQDLLDFQITFGLYKRGVISFVDTMNITEMAPFTLSYLEINYQDSIGGKYIDTFAITSVRSDRNKDATITNLVHFEDLATNTLKLSYISKGYIDKTMIEIFEDLFDTVGLQATFVTDGSERVYPNFVIPTNINTFEFIKNQCDNSNILMFSDRNGFRFVTKDIMDYGKLPLPSEPTFMLDNTPELPYWNILEYNGNILGTSMLQGLAPINAYRIDDNDLKISPTFSDIDSVYTKEAINEGFGISDSKMPELIYSVGQRNSSTISVNDREGIDVDYRSVMNSSQKIDIVVQGLIGLRMYTQIKIDLPRPRGVAGGSDIVHSGFFIITEVTDKILAGNFVQYLTIQRSDYGKGIQIGK